MRFRIWVRARPLPDTASVQSLYLKRIAARENLTPTTFGPIARLSNQPMTPSAWLAIGAKKNSFCPAEERVGVQLPWSMASNHDCKEAKARCHSTVKGLAWSTSAASMTVALAKMHLSGAPLIPRIDRNASIEQRQDSYHLKHSCRMLKG